MKSSVLRRCLKTINDVDDVIEAGAVLRWAGGHLPPSNLGLAPQTFWLQSKYALLKPNSSDVTKLFKTRIQISTSTIRRMRMQNANVTW